MNPESKLELPTVLDWHAHVYYSADTLSLARALCDRAGAELPVAIGHMHERPVGPHPQRSCQLTFQGQDFGLVVPWLNHHRSGLTVFVHPNTGDDLVDHRDRAIWLGHSDELRLAMFE